MIVNVVGVPVHVVPPFVYDGVTVIVAVTGAVLLFIALKDGIFPVPPAERPMDGVLFVQLYTIDPPVVGLLKDTTAVGALLQIGRLGTAVTVAVGFTVIVKVIAVPRQVDPFVYEGITVIVAVSGPVVAFVVTKAAILPLPLAPRPMAVLLFVQLYIIAPPAVGLLNAIALVVAPLQIT